MGHCITHSVTLPELCTVIVHSSVMGCVCICMEKAACLWYQAWKHRAYWGEAPAAMGLEMEAVVARVVAG